MKNIVILLVALFATISLAAQTTFNVDGRITSGPFIDLIDGHVVIYTWVKKDGVLAKKIGRSYNGKTAVKVDVLYVQQFDESGKLVAEKIIPTAVDANSISGMGSYIICEEGGQYSICTEKNAFAKKGDPEMEEVVEEYPKSTGKKVVVKTEAYDAKFFGAGLLGAKGPYTVTVKKKEIYGSRSKTLDEVETEVKELVTSDDNSSWKPEWTLEASRQVNPENGYSWVIYGKYVKKDKTKRHNQLQERKILSFNDKGELIAEKDVTFDNLKFSHQNLHIYDKEGNIAGFALVFIDAWGIGYKKANPTYVRENAKILLFDAEARFTGEMDIKYPVDMGMLDVIFVPLVVKTDEGHIAYMNVQGKKKAGQKASVISFIEKGGVVSKGPEKTMADLKKHANGKGGVVGIFNAAHFDKITPLNNGALLLTRSVKEVSTEKVESFPGDTYMLLDENQELISLGNIGRNDTELNKMPETIITPVSNKVIYILRGKKNSTIWILDTDDYSWEYVTGPSKNHTVFNAQVKGEDLYIFSSRNDAPNIFRLDKRTF